MAKNSLAKRYTEAVKRTSANYAEIRGQIDCDVACIAANEIFGMGEGRAKDFVMAMIGYANEIGALITEDAKADKDIVYAKAKLDERIKAIVGEKNFVPYDVRYGRCLK